LKIFFLRREIVCDGPVISYEVNKEGRKILAEALLMNVNEFCEKNYLV